MDADLLQQLRDIHLPPPVGLWPLATGWIILLALIGITFLYVAYIAFRNWHKRHCQRLVLIKLNQLEQQQDEGHCVAKDLSMLLKRAALYRYPRHEVAGLHGEYWLKFLDKTSNTTDFTEGEGRNLIVYPYHGQTSLFSKSLFNLIRIWVKQNL